ncbi:MAG: bifunctional 5,10-methylenetetrahydrofolate dehydrogenase/5,10-methenyltetrahydrofolate cyclohydrolase [Actinobacteria bacterium]|nr:bifunctional 5,10-methylenetetrahydrofolate dehydrogenase/5,10-methenyltetrahydrofolate cyclohydrolase [Actinomycetota bacterium]
MDGKTLAARVREEVADGVRKLGGVGLATVLVGDDPASDIYITLKQKAAREVGMNAVDRRLSAETTQDELLEVVAELNADDAIDGLLVQSPLPSQLDETATIEALDPAKDVDGLHPVSAGLLALGRPRLVGATPLGIMRLLAEYGIDPGGKHAVVVGRSNIVGKPVAQLLLQANATVTICHSRTDDLPRHTLDADILVAATGVLHLISPDMVKMGATVIDVGMNRTEDGLFGDVDPGAMDRAAYMTPVPGGVGPMTIAMVLSNTVRAAELRLGSLALPR